MPDGRWMIYGANGYTGRLCVERAVDRGLTPVLAGRNAERVRPLARAFGLDARVVGLDDPGRLRDALDDVDVVLHCAGPFSATAKPVRDACLDARAHYLDITGERDVFVDSFACDEAARERGVAVISGVGLDVVPTDCLARLLADEMPEAVSLDLALKGVASPSAGTLKTVVEGIPSRAAVRVDGALRAVPFGWRSETVAFATGRAPTLTAPLGDLVTAWHSTGISTIHCAVAVPAAMARGARVVDQLRGVFALRPVRRVAQAAIERFVPGPTRHERDTARTEVWGRVTDASGRALEGRLTVAEGYAFTALSAVAAVERLMAGEVGPGAHAPASAFGADFVLELPRSVFHGLSG